MGLLYLMGASSDPNPRSLFSANEPGVVFDTEEAFRRGWLWQDTAGQTLAASPGDPIGLQLDTSRGGLDALGSDLVTNGTFDADASWTKGANWTIGSGVATKTGGAANNLTQTISSTAGLWYRCTATVTRTAGTLTISLGTSGTSFAVSASGTYTFFLLAGSSTQTLTFAGDSSFAGTVDAVTARLIPGSHRYQSTSGSRPVLARIPEGGRRNLLTYTEQFDNAAWSKTSVNVSANASSPTAPDGTATADTLTASGANGTCLQSYTVPANATYVYSVYLRRRTGTGNVDIQAGDGVYSTVALTTDFQRFSISASLTSGARTPGIRIVTSSDAVDAWGGQFETGSATAYQKVTLTSDVTESGKRDCWGVLYDGSDDSFITSAVDFSSTDKMTVMSAVRKLVNTAGIIAELGTNLTSVPNTFYFLAGENATDGWWSGSRGSATSALGQVANVSVSGADTAVISSTHDISGDLTTIRRNGVSGSNATADKGSGNFSNLALYFGRRNNATLPYNGYEFATIIRGATTRDGVIRDFERGYLARRAGIVLP